MSTNIPQEVVSALASSVPTEFAGLGEPVYIGAGDDVVAYRWGTRILRLPIRAEAAELLENEYRWISEATKLLCESGFAVPTPRYWGHSSDVFEYPWTLVDYVDGEPLHTIPIDKRGHVARDLAVALATLHQPAADDAPAGRCRAAPLSMHADTFDSRVSHSFDKQLLRARFEAGCNADRWSAEPVWCHGNPHPANIIAADGRLSGLIDFGELGRGDPAVDYAGFYLGFTREHRADARVILRAMGVAGDDSLWLRARGWAAVMTASLLATDNRRLRQVGEDAAALLADSPV